MEMHQIRYVIAAADHLNFTRAAASCDVSQPALTKGIKALERELGSALFHREGRRIRVTEFGRSMLPHLRQILAEVEAACLLAQNARMVHDVPVRIGVLASVGPWRFGRFLRAFGAAHEAVDLAVSEGTADRLGQALLDDQIDIAVTARLPETEDAFSLLPLYSERYVVVLPPGHSLGTRDALPLAALDGQPYVDRLACEMRSLIAGACTDQSVQLETRFRSEREDWVQAMVLSGLGIALMPEYSVTLPGLVQRPVVEPPLSREVCIASVRGRPFPPPLAALMRMARSFAWPG
jgi:DNA-binding transcriptional LysR family regulator